MIPPEYIDKLKSNNEEEIKFSLRAIALIPLAEVEIEDTGKINPLIKKLFSSSNVQINMLARSVAGRLATKFPEIKDNFFTAKKETNDSSGTAAAVAAGTMGLGLGAVLIGGAKLIGAASAVAASASATGILAAVGVASIAGSLIAGSGNKAQKITVDVKAPEKEELHIEVINELIPLNKLREKLDSYIGLKTVKEEINALAAEMELKAKKEKAGISASSIARNLIFVGNPGTGKTEIAKIFGQFCRAYGLLKKGHTVVAQRRDLIAEHLGGTEQKVKKVVEKAQDGVLFIDEAHSLYEKEDDIFGKHAVGALLQAIETHRESMVVILAGYPDNLRLLLNTDSGLRSRFNRTIQFPDYNEEELEGIFFRLLSENGLKLAKDGHAKLTNLLKNLVKNKAKDFGNARNIRTIFEKLQSQQALRLSGKNPTQEQLRTFQASDFEGMHKVLNCGLSPDEAMPAEGINASDPLDELNALIGLHSIKEEVRSFLNRMAFQRKRIAAGFPEKPVTMHTVFLGNPGTGKTEVARLYAKILKNQGFLAMGHMVEVQRADLIGQYLGETTKKTEEVINSAMDGVLFIDEAYSLVTDPRDQYGKELISTLITAMENFRERLVVIAAGYKNEMNSFLSSNSGLKSRFAKEFQFPDYSSTELGEIFEYMAGKSHYKVNSEALSAVTKIYDAVLLQNPFAFGNAREVRNLFERVIEEFANRSHSDKKSFMSFFKQEDMENIQAIDVIKAATKLYPELGVEDVFKSA